jgi:hypothetical protein
MMSSLVIPFTSVKLVDIHTIPPLDDLHAPEASVCVAKHDVLGEDA